MHSSSIVLDRLQKALGVSTDTELASELGVKRATLGAWRSRNSTPYAECINIAERKKISLDWLLAGEGEMGVSTALSISDDLVHITEYDVCLSAGGGSYPLEHALAVGERPFDPVWLNKKGLKPTDLALVRVQGDSMEPLLKDKDIIMVDSSRVIPNDASPFAVRVEESLYIKIIQKRKNILTLNSINKAYEPIIINLEEDDCQIIGAVVWHAHSWV